MSNFAANEILSLISNDKKIALLQQMKKKCFFKGKINCSIKIEHGKWKFTMRNPKTGKLSIKEMTEDEINFVTKHFLDTDVVANNLALLRQDYDSLKESVCRIFEDWFLSDDKAENIEVEERITYCKYIYDSVIESAGATNIFYSSRKHCLNIRRFSRLTYFFVWHNPFLDMPSLHKHNFSGAELANELELRLPQKYRRPINTLIDYLEKNCGNEGLENDLKKKLPTYKEWKAQKEKGK